MAWSTAEVARASGVTSRSVSRDDVAAVLVALLDEPRTAERTLELVGGNATVEEAVRAVAER